MIHLVHKKSQLWDESWEAFYNKAWYLGDSKNWQIIDKMRDPGNEVDSWAANKLVSSYIYHTHDDATVVIY